MELKQAELKLQKLIYKGMEPTFTKESATKAVKMGIRADSLQTQHWQESLALKVAESHVEARRIIAYLGVVMRAKMKTKSTLVPYEEDEQMAFVQWCGVMDLTVHHSGNEIGGSTSAIKARAVKMKKMGTSKGFPDLLVFIPIIGVTGEIDSYQMCAIEMKRRKGGTVSKDQKRWLEILQASGAMTAVCHGADEAIAFIDAIMKEVQYE